MTLRRKISIIVETGALPILAVTEERTGTDVLNTQRNDDVATIRVPRQLPILPFGH